MPAATLQNLTAYTVQIALITALAALILRCIPVASAGFRYAYWRLVLAAVLIAPWMLRAAPRADTVAVESGSTTAPDMPLAELASAAPALTDGGIPWLALAPLILAAGTAIRLLWVAIGIARLRRLRSGGTPVADPMYDDVQQRLGTRAELRTVPGLAQPVTFGLWRPVVLLPDRFDTSPDAIRRAAVTHELLHVQRRDWLVVMAEEAVRAVFWFHPAIWWMTSRIQQAREEVIDHLAVLATGSRRAYIEALLFFADGPSLAPAPAFARRPHLFHRIVLLSKENVMSSRRIVVSGVALASILVAGGWYSSEAFPLRPSLSAAAMVAAPAVRQTGVNVVTPENPIPRRISAPAVPYPLDLAGTGLSATVQMQVMLDVAGSVTARHTSVRFGGIQPTSDLERERAVAAFAAAATNGVTAWRFEPPFNAPLAFSMALKFNAEEAATVTQSETGPGGRSGAGEAVALRIQETLTVGQPSSVHAGAGFAQTKHVDPIYPEAARSARVSGVVILEASIDVQGRVSDVRVLRSIPLLDRAALDAVRQWEYAPALLNGAPVPVIMTVTMQFLPQP